MVRSITFGTVTCLGLIAVLPCTTSAQETESPNTPSKNAGDATLERKSLIKAVNVLLVGAGKAHASGNYAQMEELNKKALKKLDKAIPSDRYPYGHKLIAITLNNIGVALGQQGKSDEAIEYFQKSIAMDRQLVEHGDTQMLHELSLALSNLASRLELLNRLPEAKECLDEALSIAKRAYPTSRYSNGHARIAEINERVGGIHARLREYDEALKHHSSALQMRRRLFSVKDHPLGHEKIVTSLVNVADVQSSLSRYAIGAIWYQEAVDMRERLLKDSGVEDPKGLGTLGPILFRLGKALTAERSYDLAILQFERCLEIMEALYPQSEHPDGHAQLVLVFDALGTVQHSAGQFREAEVYRRRSLEMQRQLYLDSGNPNGQYGVALAVNSLGLTQREQQKWAEANASFHEATKIARRLFPDKTHPQGHFLGTALTNWGDSLRASGSLADARQRCEEAVEILRAVFPKDSHPKGHDLLAVGLRNLASVRAEQGDFERAGDLMEKSIAMFGAIYPVMDHPTGGFRFVESYRRMGHLRMCEGDSAAAYKHYTKALEMGRDVYPLTTYPHGHPRMQNLLREAAIVAEKIGEVQTAEAYRREAGRLELRAAANIFRRVRNTSENSDLVREAGLLHDRGIQLYGERKFAESLVYLQRGFRLRQEAYPNSDYPRGHIDLANSLNWLGVVLQVREQHAEAKRYYETELAMRRRLFSAAEYPNGTPGQALNLQNLGSVCKDLGDYHQAKTYFEESLAMRRRLYPEELFPEGHYDIARSLNGLGTVYDAQSNMQRARNYYSQAVEMYRRAAPEPQPSGDYAMSLNNLGFVLERLDEADAAATYLEEASRLPVGLAEQHRRRMHSSLLSGAKALSSLRVSDASNHFTQAMLLAKKLYPKDRFPAGHVFIAMAHTGMGSCRLLEGRVVDARNECESALAMLDAVDIGEDPKIQEYRVLTLDALATVLVFQGENGHAEEIRREAASIQRGLSDGPLSLRSFDPLKGYDVWLANQGRFDEAEQFLLQHLQRLRQQHPVVDNPAGHSNIAQALGSLAAIYRKKNDLKKAEQVLKEALAMQRDLHAATNSGVTALGVFAYLQRLGELYMEAERLGDAGQIYEELLVFVKEEERFNEGMWGGVCKAIALRDLSTWELKRRNYDQAISYCRAGIDALGNVEQDVAWPALFLDMAHQLGRMLLARGDHLEVFKVLNGLSQMQRQAFEDFVFAASEAESLNFARWTQTSLGLLLSVWPYTDASIDEVYARVWEQHGRIQHILARKQQLALQAEDSKLRRLYQEYLATRGALGTLMSPQGRMDFGRIATLQDEARTLTQKKEELERRIAAESPEFQKGNAPAAAHIDLVGHLPKASVYIDIIRYSRVQADPKATMKDLAVTPTYAAFILSGEQPIAYVNLGAAEPIDAAIVAWRTAIADGSPAREVREELRQRVWIPIADQLVSTVHTVFLCPDGPLTALPWVALPGREPGRILLEDFAFAVVPNGPYLVRHLRRSHTAPSPVGTFLAVGDVAYDAKSESSGDGFATFSRGAQLRSQEQLIWLPLPGTRKEIDEIVALRRSLEADIDDSTIVLTKSAASLERVLTHLREVRWAHFSTHGFFADPRFRSALRLNNESFEKQFSFFDPERSGVLGRNPLVLSGLVLAGANTGADSGRDFRHDQGILSAEAIAALPLQGLELVVLSACETGIGDVAGGEGVFGLQRAFHVAGVRNVVGSLWKVDDGATAALMKVLYHKLWRENQSPIEALRQAQLIIYRNPQRLRELSSREGAEFAAVVRGLNWESPKPIPVSGENQSIASTTPIRAWAAFVLSGSGN